MTQKKPTYDVDAARAMIVEERKTRSTACWAEVEKVLEKHKCILTGSPVFADSPTGFVVRVNIWVSARED